MPEVTGILETAISVRDLGKAAEFYRRIFDFKTLVDSDRLIALDVAGRNVLLLFKAGATEMPFETPGGLIPGHGSAGRGHFAFSISSDQVGRWQKKLAECGVPVESIVKWEGGSQSIYFRDLDQHLVELITPGFWRF